MIDVDAQFFQTHLDRYARIRRPRQVLAKDNQRAVRFVDECELEFRSLGEHDKDRRRIIVWRVPRDNRYYDPEKPQLLKLAILLSSDESIEDIDDVLLPIIHELMIDEAKKQRVI